MKALLRTLLLWFLLAGVPFQGFASAAMLRCVPPAPAMVHGEHAAHAGQRDDSSHTDGEHARCGGSATCCVGAPLLPALPGVLPRIEAGYARAAFPLSMPASADLAGLDRPPKSFLA